MIPRVNTAFKELCARQPLKPAVCFRGETLTYQELSVAADKVRDALGGAHAEKKEIVAVFMEPGMDYLASIIGIMCAGHVFMPVDVNFPPKRILSIMERSRPRFFLVPEGLESFERLIQATGSARPALKKQIPPVQGKYGSICLFSLEHPARDATPKDELPEDACYVMATSGSTGEPKLILGSHKGLSHFINWEINQLQLSPEVRCTFLSHVTFDVSLRDIFVPLLAGGNLCIPTHETITNPHKLLSWMEQKKITLAHMVPTLLRAMLRVSNPIGADKKRLPHLRYILIGGEPLFGVDVANWRNRINTSTRLINVYGPSETTLAKLFYELGARNFQAQEIVPLGRPLPDTEVLILDTEGQPCVGGEVGEIHIKTPYRSWGYLNPPASDTPVFVPDRTSKKGGEPLYRTGDLGRFTGDGAVVFAGRRDDQVKLHGVRLQLGEVEAVLGMHTGVEQAAAAIKKDRFGHDRLVAYCVPTPQSLSVQELRRHLQEYLPDFMIPSRFVMLKQIPLTSSNKIDRRALPELSRERPLLEQAYVPPHSDTEKRLAGLWRQILDLDRVGINDGFFDLGGTSLLSMHLAAMIHQELGVEIPLAMIFQYPTLGMLARYIERGTNPMVDSHGAQARANKKKAAQRRAQARRTD